VAGLAVPRSCATVTARRRERQQHRHRSRPRVAYLRGDRPRFSRRTVDTGRMHGQRTKCICRVMGDVGEHSVGVWMEISIQAVQITEQSGLGRCR
jgi:hypothetical protein